MSRFEMNKGWKIFGVCVVSLSVAIGVFCAVVAIMGHINNLGFVEQFETIFNIVKPLIETPIDPPVENSIII